MRMPGEGITSSKAQGIGKIKSVITVSLGIFRAKFIEGKKPWIFPKVLHIESAFIFFLSLNMSFSSKGTGPKCVFAAGVYKMKAGDQNVMILWL